MKCIHLKKVWQQRLTLACAHGSVDDIHLPFDHVTGNRINCAEPPLFAHDVHTKIALHHQDIT